MAGLEDIARDRTDLSDASIAHLQALVAEWTLLADLGFSDLVLWLPTWNRGGFVAAAQVRPHTGPTHLPQDVIGNFLARGRRGVLDRAESTGQPVRERHPERPLVPVGSEAFPVTHAGMLVAVVERIPGVELRAEGALERVYFEAFDALADMVREGRFPEGDPLSLTDSPPRVGDGSVRIDARGDVVYASPNAQSALHRLGVRSEVTGGSLREPLARLLHKSGTVNDSLLEVLAGRTAATAELEHRGVTVTFRGIPLRPGGVPQGAMVLLRDVTDLRRREQALLTKDATIREIHHRVKNNLQTVASMLRLQARRSTSEEVRAELEEAVRRVAAIAVVHESLAHEPGADVDFDAVIDRIISMSLELLAGRGSIRREGRAGALPSEVATPLAMVLAELVGNAVEHGVGEGRAHGSVLVTVERGDSALVLHVDDDGPTAALGPEGLGLSIVRSLVSGELRGELALGPGPMGGMRASVRIPA